MVLPITLGILVALFAIQRRGTARVGGLFGPIMVLWFGTLAALGVREHRRRAAKCSSRCRRATPSRCSPRIRRRAGDLGRRISGADGRRSAVRRHGALRQAARADRVARAGLARAAAELLRSGRVAADGRRARSRIRFSRSRPPAWLPALVFLATAADDHRFAGHDFGRLLRNAPGRAARPAAARRNPANVGRRARADLRARGQRDHVSRRRRLRAGVRLVERAVGRVRRIGHRRDDHHHRARRRRRAHAMGVAAAARRGSFSACSSA